MYKLDEVPSYEGLLKIALDKIPDTYDKREGSVIFNAIAPMCMEMSYLYLKLRTYTDLVFIDTSVGSYLDRLVLQNGVERLQATYAEKYGTFNLSGLEGTIFIKDDVKFEVISQISSTDATTFVYRLKCTEPGVIGNVENGPLTSLNYIRGLTRAEITGTINAGTDIETDEHLRQRYIDNVTDIAYGGNKSDYRQKINGMDGVGSTKVIPIWNGPGTVKCIITNADYESPDSDLVHRIQQAIDPTMDGYGVGIAPVGHIVTVVGATDELLDITAEITTHNPPEDLQRQVESAINDYLASLNKNWASVDNITVRISQITNVLLDINSIIDVGEITIQGLNQNYVLEDEKIAKLNSITLNSL